MAIQKQVDTLRQGTEVWDIWRQKHPDQEIDLNRANLNRAKLSGANLSGANLNSADLIDADLRDATLNSADLFRATLSGATLSGATLSGATLRQATLSGANLSGANLSNAYLNGANLSRANLSNANLSGANLSGANLSGANLSGAEINSADLFRAKLSGANLNNTKLNSVDLSGADLSNAELIGADLSSAELIGADLNAARVGETTFGNLDLRTVKGLETIYHKAPSTIGTNTLERSEGKISDIFLQGAGLSDTFITYARSLVQSPIEYYTCFISYSSKDELFARRLHNDLQQEGVRCWFAPEDMDIGDKIKHRIDESIRLYDKLLLILSEHSIASSWVAYEVERALNKEPQGKPNVLYPVKVDKTIMTCTKTWAHDIKSTRHIGAFEHWTTPQMYEDSFKRLLRALNTKKEQQKK